MEFNNWIMPHPSAVSAAAAEAAAAAKNSVYAVVTPTGEEFEQLHNDNVSIGRAALAASSSAVQPAAGNAPFPCYGYYPTPLSSTSMTFTPLSSGADSSGYSNSCHAPSAASLVRGCHPTADHSSDEGSVIEAAQALCSLKTLGAGCLPQQHATVVDVAMKMMSSEKNEHFHDDNQEGALLRSLDVVEDSPTSDDHILSSNSLDHPDRLAIDDDVDEVNKLHQYVRKELLEIFVVPQISDSDSEDDEEDDDEDYRSTKKRKANVSPRLPTTRAAAARRESSASATASIASATSTSNATSSSSSTQRHYPGRVGFRCVHCADCRHKPASKAAFFPLRLTNIYREVCAWQRIHFKSCPMVPESVKEKYDHYKMIDTSRGKVRYWETSAKKIGLQNNPDRYVKTSVYLTCIKTACASFVELKFSCLQNL